jgi:hypothetical protein
MGTQTRQLRHSLVKRQKQPEPSGWVPESADDIARRFLSLRIA